MTDTTIVFPCNAVGLVVRGKKSAGHHPGLMVQHADCLLVDGSPIGFFGSEGAGSGGALTGSSSGRSVSRSSNSLGMNMNGIVYDLDMLKRFRLAYVDVSVAERNNVESTALLVTVSPGEGQLFEAYWRKLYTKPGVFNLLGGNCSTHAAEAFQAASIIPGEIPGLDTPDNLYSYLVKRLPSRCKSHSGFVGFARSAKGAYEMTVRSAGS